QHDQILQRQLQSSGSTTLLEGGRQMGKSSALARAMPATGLARHGDCFRLSDAKARSEATWSAPNGGSTPIPSSSRHSRR
ncbi:MAG: hypothetical protein V3T83_09140, partial [Acidobacteriota bacterium]